MGSQLPRARADYGGRATTIRCRSTTRERGRHQIAEIAYFGGALIRRSRCRRMARATGREAIATWRGASTAAARIGSRRHSLLGMPTKNPWCCAGLARCVVRDARPEPVRPMRRPANARGVDRGLRLAIATTPGLLLRWIANVFSARRCEQRYVAGAYPREPRRGQRFKWKDGTHGSLADERVDICASGPIIGTSVAPRAREGTSPWACCSRGPHIANRSLGWPFEGSELLRRCCTSQERGGL